jgi:hypothetical protein
MANKKGVAKNLRPFKKGDDPRRNLKGVPADAIAARKLFREIGAELLKLEERKKNGEVVITEISRLEAKIQLMFSSRNPRDSELILKAMYPGLLKDEVDVKGTGKDGEFIIRFIDETKKADSGDH